MTSPQDTLTQWDDDVDKTRALQSLDMLSEQPTEEGNPWAVPDTTPAATTVMEGTRQQVTPIGTQTMDVEVIGPTVAEMPPTVPRQDTKQTVLRRKQATRRAEADDGRVLHRRKRSRRAAQPVNAIPSQPYADGSVPGASATGTIASRPPRKRPHLLLLMFVLLLRLTAMALCALVVVLAVPALGEQLGDRLSLMRIATAVGSLIPSQLSGLVVIATPFGGAFRGDFAGTAFCLYVIDWLLTRLRFRLRHAY